MKRLALLVLALPGAFVPVWAQTPGPGVIGPEMRQTLRAARTVRLEVAQDYDFPSESAEGEETKPDEPKTKAEPPKKFTLPLEELATGALKLTGCRLAGPDEAADVIMMIEAHGTPRGADYVGSVMGHHYTGAELTGSVRLLVGVVVAAEADISAEIPIATTIHSYYSRPSDAPFEQTLPHYCETLFTMIGRVWGPEPLVAAIGQDNLDARFGAERALLITGDASVIPALRKMLGDKADDVRDTAALGLGVFGGAAELEPLLEALRAQPGPVGDGELLEFRRKWVVAELDKEAPGDRGPAARRLREAAATTRDMLLWALLQIDAPDKTPRLQAALHDEKSVSLRLGAAVLLGCMHEMRADEALLAALHDPEPHVRAAAARALTTFPGENVTQALLNLTQDTDLLVREQAQEALAPAQARHWQAFLAGQISSGPRSDERKSERLWRVAMQSEDALVRAQGLEQARSTTDPESLAAICRLAEHDPRVFLRSKALETLGEHPDQPVMDTLIAILRDPDRALRHQALQVLVGDATAGEETPRPPIPESALDPALALLHEKPEEHLEQALAVLRRIEGPRSLPVWRELARGDDSPYVRRQAIEALVKRKDQAATALLTGLLTGDKNEPVREAAANALAQLGDAAALDPLFALLKSGSPDSRRLAILALGKMRQPRAIGPLIAVLRASETARSGEPAEGLTGATREALETLTGKNFATGDEWLRWWKENAGKPFVPPPAKVPAAEIPPAETADPAETPKKD